MKVSYKQLMSSQAAIAELAGRKIRYGAALTIARATSLVQAEVERLESLRQKVLKDYEATLPKGATKYEFPEGKRVLFDKAWEECLATEVELPIVTVPIDKLGLSELEPGLLVPLLWLITDTEEIAA